MKRSDTSSSKSLSLRDLAIHQIGSHLNLYKAMLLGQVRCPMACLGNQYMADPDYGWVLTLSRSLTGQYPDYLPALDLDYYRVRIQIFTGSGSRLLPDPDYYHVWIRIITGSGFLPCTDPDYY